MKKIWFSMFWYTFLFFSCEEEKDPYIIDENSIGKLTRQVQVNQLDSIYVNDSIVKQLGEPELFRNSNEIRIYEKGGTPLLLLEPVQAFDSTSTIGYVQVLDPRFKTAKGLSTASTFKDIVENYNISRIENTLSAAVVFIDALDIYISIDKKELPANLRYDTGARIKASQIPNDAPLKYFMIGWD